MELSKKFRFNEQVEIAPASVVSKQIINNDKGNITLFAFDKGEGLSEHTAPYDALVMLVDGKAEIIIGGVSHILQENENILMPANIPHALKAIESFKMVLVMIKA
jgi:quercetin dioxygenase-like cupin family protein